ncbi:MAG: RNA-binding S4 domain-containing protein [Magnetococcales bacterium]|nr:RNA-binding S4 domain-containing protein [Magnetococcales bacterium]
MARKESKKDDEFPRLDKWLWAARFFKTRSLAAEAIKGGKVNLGRVRAKPGRQLKVGDRLEIRKAPYTYLVEVVELSSRRGSGKEAAKLYKETKASREAREILAIQIKNQPVAPDFQGGRPTKRDRRRMDKWREG